MLRDLFSLTNILRVYLPSLLSGTLLVPAFPTGDLFALAWVSLIPFLLVIQGRDAKTAFWAGFLMGLPYFGGTLYWIYHSLHVYGHISLAASIAAVLLLCLYLSLYPAVFAVLCTRTMRSTDLPLLVVAPVYWTSLEYIRSYALTGFPWSSLGYSQYSFLPLIQISDITGVYGISFLVVAFNAALVDVMIFRLRKRERPLLSLLPTLSGLVLLVVAISVAFLYGFTRLAERRDGTEIRVAVVQGNIDQDKKWDSAFQLYVRDVYYGMSLRTAQVEPHLIIWPETSIPFVFNDDKKRSADLAAFQKGLGTYLLFGSILRAEQPEQVRSAASPPYSNSAVLLDKDGTISYVYDKIHLVPFGEYVPLRKLLFFIDKLAYTIGDYEPGDDYVRALTPFGSFATLICYEVIFPGLTRKFFIQGGDFIVNLTNDAWFGRTNGPFQHFSMAVFRAVENRKPVVRAANTGISGVIDSNGRIVRSTSLFERTAFVDMVRTDRKLTFYTRYGDVFSYSCILIALLLARRKRFII